MTELPILIAGGGIGGLAAACGLAQKGMQSIVLEKAAELGEIGAGIQIAPNAFHCFDYLGVGEEARAVAVYVDHMRLMDAKTAQEIAAIPLDENFRARFGNPYAVVHRADLHGVLLKFCEQSPLVEIRTRLAVTGYGQAPDTATVYLQDNEPVTGSLLIGAEGLKSPIRAQLVGDGEPRISGHTTYRSVIPTEKMPKDLRWNAPTLWAGPKCHIVHYPLKGGKAFNLVVTYHRDVQEAIAGRPVSREDVAVGFEHIHPKIRQVIEVGEDWRLWVLCDREPTSKWVEGRVGLLGDAAHPMLQYFAQGASMAMEDAVALSHSVETHGPTPQALVAYRDMRLVRATRVQVQSRLIGDYVYHPDDALAAVRNQMLGTKSPEDWCNTLGWLYGSNGLEN